jgi:hypothetical protein
MKCRRRVLGAGIPAEPNLKKPIFGWLAAAVLYDIVLFDSNWPAGGLNRGVPWHV